MNDVYFTSDTHFDHENVIRHASRPRCFGETAYYLEDFHATGHFRSPTMGEFYLSKFGLVFKATSLNETSGGLRMILKPKPRGRRLIVESPDAAALPRLSAQPHAEAK